MHDWSSAFTPYPCRSCGVAVRSVITVDGDPLTINDAPSPSGNLIPWPAETHTGLARARLIHVPVKDSPMWEVHSCR